ncbi:hypothetical protein POM88_023034 [Heracleum sosnowskyi]|uniref:Uncharacterized protein n=1 Tax=Heracleum sosnowskyi TaxID=360622 RepID=A0AAD8IGA1_9APIA|nr:hypothetical protein POM88_023034 [Heracleum sosnowskyi]
MNQMPMWPGVPFVVQRPRKNIVAAGNTETVKRAFVSSHQLQQQRNYKKIARSPQMQELRPEPVNTRPEPVNTRPEPVNTRGMTKRKLDLSKNTNVEQPMNPYELARLNRVQQNKEKFNELGLGKYASNPSQPSVEESKTKNKNGEEDDEYVPIEDEIETEDERIKSIKERISKPGPRTRSRANAMDLGDKDMRNAIEKEGKQVDTAKILKPTCSKLLKAADNSVPSGSVAAYIALRERQKQNLEADPMIENDVGESSLQPADEVVEAGPKKRRGRSKMLKVHARTVNEKVVIKVNKKGQPIGDRKLKAERTKEVDAGIYFAKYWSDGEVQSFAEDNKARRNSYVETHTLGPKSYAEVKNKLKNKDPNHASPSDARMYLKSRDRKSRHLIYSGLNDGKSDRSNAPAQTVNMKGEGPRKTAHPSEEFLGGSRRRPSFLSIELRRDNGLIIHYLRWRLRRCPFIDALQLTDAFVVLLTRVLI